MSWSGFKKALDRAGTRVMQKSGKLHATDHEYEESLVHLKKLVIRLMNALEDFMRGMDTFLMLQLEICQTAKLFQSGGELNDGESGCEKLSDGDSGYGESTNEYSHAITTLRKDSSIGFQHLYVKFIRTSLQEIILHVCNLSQLICKEHRKRLDYDRLRLKLEKAKENPHNDTEGLYRAMREFQEAKTVYDEIGGQLKQELTLLSLLRLPIVDPIFETFVKLQALYFRDVHAKCFQVLHSNQWEKNCFDKEVGRIFSSISALRQM